MTTITRRATLAGLSALAVAPGMTQALAQTGGTITMCTASRPAATSI